MDFYDREEEQKILNEKLNSKNSYDLIVISGRRRIGKTELIKHLKYKGIYFYVTKETKFNLLKDLTTQVREYFNDKFITFEDFNSFFEYLIEKAKFQNLTIIFDEFQNFESVDKAFFSIMQKYIDRINSEDIPLKIIAMGSYIRLIKDIFNSSSAALYGRKTAQTVLKPLRFRYIKQLLEKEFNITDDEEIINFYGVFGGIPKYYKLFEGNRFKNLTQVLDLTLFRSVSMLESEIKEVFYEQVIEIKKEYLSIIKAIALGFNTNKKISDYTNIEKTSIPTYINDLMDIYEIVGRKIPITEDYLKSKKGVYYIKDSFLHFWFFFIEKNRSSFELEQFDYIKDQISKHLNDFLGRNVFENVAREYVQKYNKDYVVGSWWIGETEIDDVGINDTNKVILGECKYSNKKVGFTLFNELLEKFEKLKGKEIKKIYLFSKSGFEENLQEKAKDLNVELVDLNKLVEGLS
ncbi:MAG: ATP-binding protein [Nanoarchaeota archaeon]